MSFQETVGSPMIFRTTSCSTEKSSCFLACFCTVPVAGAPKVLPQAFQERKREGRAFQKQLNLVDFWRKLLFFGNF